MGFISKTVRVIQNANHTGRTLFFKNWSFMTKLKWNEVNKNNEKMK
jgi:hypothetical protein